MSSELPDNSGGTGLTNDDAMNPRPPRGPQSTADNDGTPKSTPPAANTPQPRPTAQPTKPDPLRPEPAKEKPAGRSSGPATGAMAAIGAAASWMNRARRHGGTPKVAAGDQPTPVKPKEESTATPVKPKADTSASVTAPKPTPVTPKPETPKPQTPTPEAPKPEATKPQAPKPEPGRPVPGTLPVPQPVASTAPKPVEAKPVAIRPADQTPKPATPAAAPAPRGPEFAKPEEQAAKDAEAEAAAEVPHNPFAELEDDEPPRRRLPFGRRNDGDDAPAGKRAAGRTSIFTRKPKAPVGRRALERRNTTAITVSVIAGLAALAAIVTYLLWTPATAPKPTGPTAVPGVSPGPALSESMMMTDQMARFIDPSRQWSTTVRTDTATDQAPGAACIGPQATGQPMPQTTEIRGLEASGNDKMQVLHRADAFGTAEEATRVYNFRANELGGCVGSPLYVEKGMEVSGLGNQSLGVRVVLLEQKSEYHTIILARTGKVVDVIDVVRFGQPADINALAQAAAQVVNRQCTAAVGLCAAPKVKVDYSVPPPGGDQPGFLAAGDIPRITVGQGSWKGNALTSQIDIQEGSTCESIDFNTTAGATARQQRTYLLRNDPKAPANFGIDEVVLTMNSPQDATGLVGRVAQSIESCEQRTRNAKVANNPRRDIQTPGLGGIPVAGKWYQIQVGTGGGQFTTYRVGILAAGQKVIYLRSNTATNFDFTDEQWLGVALRAGERATQAR